MGYGKSVPGRGIRLCQGLGARSAEQQPVWEHLDRTVAVGGSRLRAGRGHAEGLASESTSSGGTGGPGWAGGGQRVPHWCVGDGSGLR